MKTGPDTFCFSEKSAGLFHCILHTLATLKLTTSYRLALAAILVVFWSASLRINQKATGFQNILHADAAGYYVWLPAVFQYQDSRFLFADTVFSESEYYPKGFFKSTIVPVNGADTMNKYSPGAAVSSLPFYLAAHAYGLAIQEHRGYEIHYQLSWLIAALFYVSLGVFSLFRMAALYRRPWYLPFGLSVLLLFGTNLFHYATWDAGYTHAFTFGWAAFALWKFSEIRMYHTRHFTIAAAALAMLVLIRPFNILLTLPLVFSVWNPKELWEMILKNQKRIFISLLVFLAMVLILFIGNYWQTGQFLVYSYGNEKFHFDRPHFWEFLFGAEVGVFLYSPLVLLLMTGASLLWIRNGRWAQVVLACSAFFAVSWLLSCWDSWTFGCTMGNRPLTDWYIIFAKPVIAFLPGLRKGILVSASLLLATGIYYNQVLHYQYRNWIMDWCNRNWSDFKDVFLKTADTYRFYMSDDWNFPPRKSHEITRLDVRPGVLKIEENEKLILHSDSLNMDTVQKWRIRFHCRASFSGRRGEDVLEVHLSNAAGYYGYYQKMIKKEVKKADEWQDFVFEFQIAPSTAPVNAKFYIRNHGAVPLSVGDVSMELIGF